MGSLESLDEQLKEILLLNGGDIDISKYPYILKDAHDLGLNQVELSRRIRNVVVPSIDWAPYHTIDKLLEEKKILVKESILENEAIDIIQSLENELPRPRVENYIRSVIRKRGFKTWEKKDAEADSFKNLWMTADAWMKYQRESIVVEWLKEDARSLAELGEISYRKPEDARYYLRNTNFLVPIIITLTKSSSKAEEFSKIIENEPNLEKRYLKVIYRLNSALPFKIGNREFASLAALFEATATDYDLFIEASGSYTLRHLHIWINETDPVNVNKLTSGWDYNNFLTFLYSINSHHPFYLDKIRFDSPEQMIQKAEKDASLWNRIANAFANQQLPIWLAGIGKQHWLDMYNRMSEKIKADKLYTDDERKLALVESFIKIVEPALPKPKIVSEPQSIQLLTIEGSKKIEHRIHLRLHNSGFAKAVVQLDKNVAGISLDNTTLLFWSQTKLVEHALILSVEALQLIKNKQYSFNINVDTSFEKLVIPVELKVVFPRKAYLTQMFKYSVFGAVFFALIRYIAGIMAGNDGWLSLSPAPEDSTDFLPLNYFSYFIALVLLIGGLIGSIFLIKKLEKL